jgi:glutamine cyclotransferase
MVAMIGSARFRATAGTNQIYVNTKSLLPGSKSVSVTAFYKDTNQVMNFAVLLLSEIMPAHLSYKVIATYPHDPKHFTEGLFYYDNNLFEGTGEWNESGVFKSELKTGKILKEVRIPNEVFGEGIAIVGNNLYELTYQSGVGYIYNKNTFEKVRTFNYPMQTEGWGMTTDGKDLILTNGSDRIYYWDTTCTMVKRELPVYDNQNSVDSLNEIEYVNGIIYSNVWQENTIVKIDATTGKVLGYLDLTNMIPLENRDSRDNVLNGIAYNEKSKTFYVTGKRWKQIFEIKILE